MIVTYKNTENMVALDTVSTGRVFMRKGEKGNWHGAERIVALPNTLPSPPRGTVLVLDCGTGATQLLPGSVQVRLVRAHLTVTADT